MSKRAQRVGLQAKQYQDQGYHCSEAIILAVAPVMVPNWHHDCIRLATCFGGGVAGSRLEICGALSGSIMVIGAIFGRSKLQDDTHANYLAAQFRRMFEEKYTDTQCGHLREHIVYTEGGLGSCSVLTQQTAEMLVDFLLENGVTPVK